MLSLISIFAISLAFAMAFSQPTSFANSPILAARESYLRESFSGDDSDRAKQENATVSFLTPHTEVVEGRDAQLRCEVELVEADEPFHVVEWLFVTSAVTPDSKTEVKKPVIARNGENVPVGDSVEVPGGYRAFLRTRWDTVNDLNVEEHYLDLEPALLEHQGMYICQVSLK